MAQVARIQIERDTKGQISYVRINVKKHPEFLLQLEKLGVLSEDEFEKKWNTGITDDELFGALHDKINTLFKNDDRL